jgi:hypothetical protein
MFAAAPALAQNPSAANPANSDIGLSQTTKEGAKASSEQGAGASQPTARPSSAAGQTEATDPNTVCTAGSGGCTIPGKVGGVDQDATTSATPPGPAAGGTN